MENKICISKKVKTSKVNGRGIKMADICLDF